MQLYELDRQQYFVLEEQPKQPSDITTQAKDIIYQLDHIDGAYSYVTDGDENVYHFAAWTEVTPIELPLPD